MVRICLPCYCDHLDLLPGHFLRDLRRSGKERARTKVFDYAEEEGERAKSAQAARREESALGGQKTKHEERLILIKHQRFSKDN